MLQLFKCVLCLVIVLMAFTVWGHSFGKWLGLREMHLPLKILCGGFSFFVVSQIVIIPMVFMRSSLKHTTWLWCLVILVLTMGMLYKDNQEYGTSMRQISIDVWTCLMLMVLGGIMLLAVRQQYLGYDTCYYVGQMNAFLQYDAFWTRDAFMGMAETSVIPLHYALSCFYPLWAMLAYIFQIEARLIAMYTARALCVLLSACVAYTWGYELFGKKTKLAQCFVFLCLLLGMFALSEHSSSSMMMVRGYESKGYCAAVVAPMCMYALIKLFQDIDAAGNWKLLGLIAWASMPIAMSSMAIIPVAIAIVGLALMIEHRRVWDIFWKCFICVLPNMCFMAWYVLGN